MIKLKGTTSMNKDKGSLNVALLFDSMKLIKNVNIDNLFSNEQAELKIGNTSVSCLYIKGKDGCNCTPFKPFKKIEYKSKKDLIFPGMVQITLFNADFKASRLVTVGFYIDDNSTEIHWEKKIAINDQMVIKDSDGNFITKVTYGSVHPHILVLKDDSKQIYFDFEIETDDTFSPVRITLTTDHKLFTNVSSDIISYPSAYAESKTILKDDTVIIDPNLDTTSEDNSDLKSSNKDDLADTANNLQNKFEQFAKKEGDKNSAE